MDNKATSNRFNLKKSSIFIMVLVKQVVKTVSKRLVDFWDKVRYNKNINEKGSNVKITNDIKELEKQMFSGVVVCFQCLEFKQPKGLSRCLMALNQIEQEYMKTTKKAFIAASTRKRLESGLRELLGVKSVAVKTK